MRNNIQRLKMGKRNLMIRSSVAPAKGYGSLELEGQVKHGGSTHEEYYISEEDIRFVEALREAQPYVYLHRGSIFVVVISGDLLATPSLLDILVKVLSLSLPLSCPWRKQSY
jgi:hypothetical protein